MRSFLVVSVVALSLQVGCDEKKTLMCGASIANACATPGSCVLTWEEAGLGTAFCDATRAPPVRVDCGSYHALTFAMAESARTYYYDRASGMLVAIVNASAPLATTTCEAGPATGFTLPTCSGAGSEALPQCIDGGTDGSAVTDGPRG